MWSLSAFWLNCSLPPQAWRDEKNVATPPANNASPEQSAQMAVSRRQIAAITPIVQIAGTSGTPKIVQRQPA